MGSQKLQLKRVMVVSKAYDSGLDFSHQLKRISELCDEHDCQLLVYALSSYGDGNGQWYPPKRLLFGRSKKIQSVVLEVCDWEDEVNSDHFRVQVWQRNKPRPDIFLRKLAKSSEPDERKTALVAEMKTRTYSNFKNKNWSLVICGELGALKVRHDGTKRVEDPFGLRKAIAFQKSNIVLNPWHTHGKRFEHDVKRRYLSNKRIYLGVWNQRRTDGKGEPPVPWIAYKSAKKVDIKELPRPVIPKRPDIRVGILQV